ncbi:MAG: DUF4255 domain-containing protein [Saprospiraceae bacterium]|nr:DUF4255 domain-containing protein [Saprospiraceae bacterium]
MIQEALSYIAEELNDYFRLKYAIADDKVIISNLVNPDGSNAIKEDNKVILTLVNIEEEKLMGNASNLSKGSGVFSRSNPPVKLNLYILFSTSYTGKLTEEGLKFISIIIGFFQGKRVFTPENSPGLDSDIEKMIIDMQNLGFQELNNLWASLGAKYSPSVMYRLRMLTIEEGLVKGIIPGISGRDDSFS